MQWVVFVNGCGTPCFDGSTSCCVRGACGCVETAGLIEGCTASCTANDGLRCSTRCDEDSKACCVVKYRCGCTDLEAYINNGGSDSDCQRTCSVGEQVEDMVDIENIDSVLPTTNNNGSGSLGAFWFSFGFIVCAGIVVGYFKFKQFNSKSKWQSVPEIEEIHNQLF